MSRALIIHLGASPRGSGSWEVHPWRVLQATPLLRVLADHEVTWLTSAEAAPLLWANPLVDRLLLAGPRVRAALLRERFDLVLNLDPAPGSCALADQVRARRRRGYTWENGAARARLRTTPALARPLAGRSYQEWVFALVGRTWTGEEYVLGYRPRSRRRFDVGLCCLDGGAPSETGGWPAGSWQALQRRLRPRLSVALPSSGNGPLAVIDWVNACRTVVAAEGLALHAAVAVGVQVVALLTGEQARRVHLYGRGVVLTPPAGAPGISAIPPAAVDRALEELWRRRLAG